MHYSSLALIWLLSGKSFIFSSPYHCVFQPPLPAQLGSGSSRWKTGIRHTYPYMVSLCVMVMMFIPPLLWTSQHMCLPWPIDLKRKQTQGTVNQINTIGVFLILFIPVVQNWRKLVHSWFVYLVVCAIWINSCENELSQNNKVSLGLIPDSNIIPV